MIYFTLFTLNQGELEIDLKKKTKSLLDTIASNNGYGWKTGLLYDSF